MKKILSMLISLLLILFPLCACDNSTHITITGGNPTMIFENDNYYILDNGVIQVKVCKDNGYIETIYNKITKVSHKNSEEGAWPFMIEVGEDRVESSISAECKNKISSVSITTTKSREYLNITYDDLVTDGSKSKSTGVKATSHISIAKNDEYIKISVDLDTTKAKEGVSRLSFVTGGDLVSGDENERMTAPTWGGGSYWVKPSDNKFFNSGVTIGYPGWNTMSLEAGWIDIHGENSGIGVAVIDKQELYMEFDIESRAQLGMSISPTIFRTSNQNIEYLELETGNKFKSDEVIVAPHSGDWHTLADIYRKEYQKAFVKDDGTPDYLTIEDIKSSKLNNYTSMIRNFCGLDGQFVATFDDMINQYNAFLETGVEPQSVLFWVTGQNPQGYAFDVPFMTPTYELSGGDEGMKALANALHANSSGLFVYEHPFAVDPNNPVIASVLDEVCPGGKDTPQHTERWNLCTHYSVCTYNQTMYSIWKNNVLPPIIALGIDGLQFDQASLVQTICDREGHYHGTDGVSRLSSIVKGTVELSKLCLEKLPQGGFLMSEGFNDLTARYTASGSNGWFNTATLLWGATDYEFGCTQYTHPQYRWVSCGSVSYSANNSVNVGVLLGGVLGGISQPNDNSVKAKLEYVNFRKNIKADNAPGFPYGFKDTVGLSLSDSSVTARVFTDGEKITLTYTSFYGSEASKAIIDLNKLGIGSGQITVDIPAIEYDSIGYMIIDPANV